MASERPRANFSAAPGVNPQLAVSQALQSSRRVHAGELEPVGLPARMRPEFRQFVESLEPQLESLLASAPRRFSELSGVPKNPGIYLFSEGAQHLYVGRTSNLRNRLRAHCSSGSTHASAAFAFRIARAVTGNLKATYRPEGSRASLAADPKFAAAFTAAKERLAAMDIRYVEESDPVRQTLLEVYAAVILRTPYNDFENH